MAFGVLADDLTGALDGGLQLYRRGFSVSVYYSAVASELSAEQADIVVLDTESRNVAVDDAVEKTEEAVSLLRKNHIPIMCKKVDSTLRGNPGAELEALLKSAEIDAAVITPALPHTGRTVSDGVLYVHGVPVAGTEFATDPHSPIESSNIREIITKNASLTCIQLNRRSVYRAAKDPEKFLDERLPGELPAVYIADAENGKDLQRVAQFAAGCGDRLLACGSAGLLEHLAACMEASSPAKGSQREVSRTGIRRLLGALIPRITTVRRSAAHSTSRTNGRRPALVVSSSMSEVTRRQIEYVVSRGRVVWIRPEIQDVFKPDTALVDYSRRILQALSEGKHVLFDAGGKRGELPASQTQIAEQSAALQGFLSQLMVAVMKEIRSIDFGGLVITGGETAINVCTSLGACGIRIRGEIEPLVPTGTLIGGMAENLPVITKAGGFGSDAVIEKGCLYLTAAQTSRRL